jgi:hypothetical protein
VSDVTTSVQQERLTKLEFVKLQVMFIVTKTGMIVSGKKNNCTLWNYCNNLYITYIVFKLGESTEMLISVRMLRTTIASYYLPFWSLYTVYDIELLLHHGFAVIRALDCRKSNLNLSWRLKGRYVCRLSRQVLNVCGELKLRANCMKWEIIQTNSSCIVCATLLDCWTEGYIHRFFKREVLFCNVTK